MRKAVILSICLIFAPIYYQYSFGAGIDKPTAELRDCHYYEETKPGTIRIIYPAYIVDSQGNTVNCSDNPTLNACAEAAIAKGYKYFVVINQWSGGMIYWNIEIACFKEKPNLKAEVVIYDASAIIAAKKVLPIF